MIFTVTYKPSAEQELADLWLNGPDRQAVTDAANRIDALLKADPFTQGESRDGLSRILFERPLAVQMISAEPDSERLPTAIWVSG
jgi:hypothetical protein